MDSITEAIARNIKERRRALGLTQASLAEAIGYSVKAVSKWESGTPSLLENSRFPQAKTPRLPQVLPLKGTWRLPA